MLQEFILEGSVCVSKGKTIPSRGRSICKARDVSESVWFPLLGDWGDGVGKMCRRQMMEGFIDDSEFNPTVIKEDLGKCIRNDTISSP